MFEKKHLILKECEGPQKSTESSYNKNLYWDEKNDFSYKSKNIMKRAYLIKPFDFWNLKKVNVGWTRAILIKYAKHALLMHCVVKIWASYYEYQP